MTKTIMTKTKLNLCMAQFHKVNGLFNKTFHPFDVNILNLLKNAEGVVAQSYSLTPYEDIVKVTTTNKREYLIFQDVKSAEEYAVMLGVKLEDDPHTLKAIKKLNDTVKGHYEKSVYVYGAEVVLSYDQTHKVTLSNGMIAYRTL